MTTVHITFIGPVPPIRSGISQHGGNLATALSRHHDVTVLSWRDQYPKLLFRRAQTDADVEPHPMATFGLRWWDPVSWIRAAWTARHGDIVVFPWTTPFHALTYRVVVALAGRARTVAIVHNALPHEPLPFQRAITRSVLSHCDGFVVHASSVAGELADLIGAPVSAVSTPHPPNVTVVRHPLPPVDEGMRLLFFGFIRPYKGLDVALDALAVLRDRGVRHHLTVVGEPWDPSESWANRVAERGLEDQVDLCLGYATDAQVSDLLAKHHAALLPYRSATQSGIAPIALAAGRPVVATAVGGLRDVIREGENGTLAEPDDPVSLADAIERCAADLTTLAAGASHGVTTWDDVASAVVRAAGIDEL